MNEKGQLDLRLQRILDYALEPRLCVYLLDHSRSEDGLWTLLDGTFSNFQSNHVTLYMNNPFECLKFLIFLKTMSDRPHNQNCESLQI